jgi:hypothetical protein
MGNKGHDLICPRKGSVATAFGLALVAVSRAATAMNITCDGKLTVKDDELQLEPDSGSALFCDASFEGEKYQVTKPGKTRQVRAVCSEGNRCRVTGEVQGHGVFYWAKITSVKKLPSPAPDVGRHR